MIIINNITPQPAPAFGQHIYELLVNDELILFFNHLRQPRALSQCLRDAANAMDKADEDTMEGGVNEVEKLKS